MGCFISNTLIINRYNTYVYINNKSVNIVIRYDYTRFRVLNSAA